MQLAPPRYVQSSLHRSICSSAGCWHLSLLEAARHEGGATGDAQMQPQRWAGSQQPRDAEVQDVVVVFDSGEGVVGVWGARRQIVILQRQGQCEALHTCSTMHLSQGSA